MITVSQWDGEEETLFEHVCVRCQGAGVLTDGLTLGDIQRPPDAELWRTQTCTCHYPTDGPMGNPRCPAR